MLYTLLDLVKHANRINKIDQENHIPLADMKQICENTRNAIVRLKQDKHTK